MSKLGDKPNENFPLSPGNETGKNSTSTLGKNSYRKPKSPKLELTDEEMEEYTKYFRMKRVSKSKREPIRQD